jgi:hypothetical protein
MRVIMIGRLAVATVALGLLASCDGGMGLAGVPDVPALRADRLTTGTTVTGAPMEPLRFLPGSPPLLTYDTTAIVQQGRHSWLEIFHADLDWFMVLDMPPSAQFVHADGTPVPAGQKVEVRARVDHDYVMLEFEPHGSYFTGPRPVELWINLKYIDREGRTSFPAIWYQAESGDPWTAVPTEVRQAGRWLVIKLTHFSNYAVAY